MLQLQNDVINALTRPNKVVKSYEGGGISVSMIYVYEDHTAITHDGPHHGEVHENIVSKLLLLDNSKLPQPLLPVSEDYPNATVVSIDINKESSYDDVLLFIDMAMKYAYRKNPIMKDINTNNINHKPTLY